ncbi:hypothetical protein NG796_17030 [Laspinema sp. A4]|uniref:hypothetical protein n=1 Tax=Laspinema sp. D2d TaxID=2953686 RepID=UPI0021BB3B0E|nr:hypothetical protein [Laspinema sp. D2d]MCT7984978.1 hypothetical protein [Laspinema sp. D2d]
MNIVTFEQFENQEIRVTEDGRYSVYDVIRFCGQKNPHEVWKRLCREHSELLTRSEKYKFPGRGGAARATPVADRSQLLYIIGLLPGAVGQAYREDAAKVFLQYLEASPELAESVIDRASPEDLERIKLRLQGKEIRVSFTTVLHNHGVVEGWQFGACTNAMYRPLLGGSCKEVKLARGLSRTANLRDHLETEELVDIMFAERLAKRQIESENLSGYKPCLDACENAAHRTRQALDG